MKQAIKAMQGYLMEEVVLSEIQDVLGSDTLKFPFFRSIGPNGIVGAPPEKCKLLCVDFLSSKCTWILQHSELYMPSIRNLSEHVFKVWGKKTNTNIYISSPDSFSFGRHFDQNDAWVFQILGCKNWKIWRGKEHVDCTLLQAEGALYLPGYVDHEVNTADQPSIHLTMSLHTDEPTPWRSQKLTDKGPSKYGHLDSECFEFRHPVWGMLDPDIYSRPFSKNSDEFNMRTINWNLVSPYLEQGFLFYEKRFE